VPTGARGWSDPRRYQDVAPGGDGRTGELAFVKLRYKLPDGTTSRLIERPVSASLMRTAERPSGDFAFATAVAAFGQKLRGDAMLNGFTHTQIAALAGRQNDYWRQEFVRLVGLAGSMAGGDAPVERERAGG
jgi:Ca-activated chloride channel family protein